MQTTGQISDLLESMDELQFTKPNAKPQIRDG